MANKVRLVKSAKIGGVWKRCGVVMTPNGRVKAGYVLVDGKPEHHPEGQYYLVYRQAGRYQFEPVGDDATSALEAKIRREHILRSEELGIVVAEDERRTHTGLADAISGFLAEIKAHRTHKTWLAYQLVLNQFLELCGKKSLEQIDRTAILTYVAALRAEGLSDRTVHNRLCSVLSFLKTNDISGLLARKDRPKFTEKDVDVYEDEEMKAFFAHCDPGERLLFQFFLCSGGREREVAFTAWRDLDLKNRLWSVKAKPQMGFKPKDYEERTVPLNDKLVSDLKEWRRKHPDDFLVFPNGGGDSVNGHMLRDLKRIAFEAKLNCGHCRARGGEYGEEKTLSCKTAPVCKQWYLHKWRHTFATRQLQNGEDIKTVQAWLGHSDLTSTLRYLKAANVRSAAVRARVNTTFEAVL